MGTYAAPEKAPIDKSLETVQKGLAGVTQLGIGLELKRQAKKEADRLKKEKIDQDIITHHNKVNKDLYDQQSKWKEINQTETSLDETAGTMLNTSLDSCHQVCKETINTKGQYTDNQACMDCRRKLDKLSNTLATSVALMDKNAKRYCDEGRTSNYEKEGGLVVGPKYKQAKSFYDDWCDKDGANIKMEISANGEDVSFTYINPNDADDTFNINALGYIQGEGAGGVNDLKYLTKENTSGKVDRLFKGLSERSMVDGGNVFKVVDQTYKNESAKVGPGNIKDQTIKDYTQAHEDMIEAIKNQKSLQGSEELWQYLNPTAVAMTNTSPEYWGYGTDGKPLDATGLEKQQKKLNELLLEHMIKKYNLMDTTKLQKQTTIVGKSKKTGTTTSFIVPPSDRRLKKNIKQIGLSPSGLKIYTFKYIDKSFGKGIWQGVMSDEIPKEVVYKHNDGYDRVDYSQLDVEYKNVGK